MVERTSLLHNKVQIYCPLVPGQDGPSEPNAPVHLEDMDAVKVVFWYKGLNSNVPFSTVDVRNMTGQEGKALNVSLVRVPRVVPFLVDRGKQYKSQPRPNQNKGDKAYLRQFLKRSNVKVNMTDRMAVLTIEDVRLEDEGVYRCRVDFRWARTTNKFWHLNLIGKFGWLDTGMA